MNTIAVYFVFDHLERLREEAARDRWARELAPRPSALGRLRAALGSLAARILPTDEAALASS